MDEAIDALLHLDEQAEVGEVAHLSGVLGLHRELELDVVPRIRNELLHAEAHLPLLAVDAQHDGLDLVSHLQELLGAAQVLAPAHLADVEQTLDAFGHFHKGTVVGHDHNLALDLVSDVDRLGHGIPRVSRELLDAEGNPLAVVVEVEDDHVEALVDFDHFLRMAHAAPAEVGDVHQSVHTAEVDEHTVAGDVLDDAFEDLTLLQSGNDLALLLFQLGLDEGLVGDHDVLVLLVDLDDFEFHLLADVLVVVADGLDVDLAARQEGLDAEHVDDESTLGAALDRAHDDLVILEGSVDLDPRAVDAGGPVGHHELTVAVLLLLHEHRHHVSDAELGVVTELGSTDDALGLIADVHHHFLLADAHDRAIDHLRFTDEVEAAFIEVLQLGPLFRIHLILLGILVVPVELVTGDVQLAHHPGLSGLLFLGRSLFSGGSIFSGRSLFSGGSIFSGRGLLGGSLFSGRSLLGGSFLSGRSLFSSRSLLGGSFLSGRSLFSSRSLLGGSLFSSRSLLSGSLFSSRSLLSGSLFSSRSLLSGSFLGRGFYFFSGLGRGRLLGLLRLVRSCIVGCICLILRLVVFFGHHGSEGSFVSHGRVIRERGNQGATDASPQKGRKNRSQGAECLTFSKLTSRHSAVISRALEKPMALASANQRSAWPSSSVNRVM